MYAKGEGVLDKNHTFNLLDSTNKESSKIEGDADLLNRVHANFAKSINLCIANDGNYIEDVISIKINSKNKASFQLHDKYSIVLCV